MTKTPHKKEIPKTAILVTLFLVAFTLLLAHLSQGHNFALIETKGLIAEKEKALIYRASALIATIIIPVYFITVLFAWRYREGNKNATYSPEWENAPYDELIWWAVPIEIILVLGMMTYHSTFDLDPYKPLESEKAPITIEVVSLDWKWLFIYPDQHIASVNLLEIPKGRPINLKITADAPMNSFWIPALAGQIYAMPGMVTPLHIIADAVGDYRGLAANFSGPGFSDMTFTTRSVSEEDFNAWTESTSHLASPLTNESYSKLAEQSTTTTQLFGNIPENLFDRIVSKTH